MAAKKRILRVEPEPIDTAIRLKVPKTTESLKEIEAMLKDVHLIEAALATDSTVIALDEIVRALFGAACQTIGQMKSIVWINPDKPEEQILLWLENGAEPEKSRQLGFQQDAVQ